MLGVIALGFIVIVPIERIWRRHDQKVIRCELATDFVHAAFSGVLALVFLVVPAFTIIGLLILAGGPQDPRPLAGFPPLVQALLAMLVLDLAAYLAHRVQHEVPLLWRFHSVHHSSQKLDFFASFRNHPADAFAIGLIAAGPLYLIGFDAIDLGILGAAQNLLGVFFHANVRWRFRWLDWLLVTPEYHHWHHSAHVEAINRNYAVIFPWWDRLLGTRDLPRDRRPMAYGIHEPMPATWIAQMLHPFRGRRQTVLSTPA